MPVGGSNKQSIFPEYKWSYEDRASACEFFYNVTPRPHWITTEFGGHVRFNYKLFLWFHFSFLNTTTCSSIMFSAGYSDSSEKVCKQHYILQWFKRSLEWWRVFHAISSFLITMISIMLKPHYLLQGVKEYIKNNSCSCWKKRLVSMKVKYIICVLVPFFEFSHSLLCLFLHFVSRSSSCRLKVLY